MSAGRPVEGAGCVTWWGFGPARDLLQAGPVRQQGDLNILLVGSGDPRHILKTIAGLRDSDTLHVWVMENSMEVVARQLLLVHISLFAPDMMGLQEKTELFLEMFGNSEIRSHTAEALRQAAARLSLSLSDTPGCPTHPCLDTSPLKFRERDELAWIFKQWLHPPSTPPSMCKAWDARVRQHLGARYDSRLGSFDWDLAMKLHQRGGSLINKQQYVRWRERGVAFEMREGLYQVANQSLLSTRVFSHRGDKVAVRGYWGDIVSSPYLAFGIETEDKELLKKQNNQHIKTAQEISMVNIQKLLASIISQASALPVSQQANQAGDAAGPSTNETEQTQSDVSYTTNRAKEKPLPVPEPSANLTVEELHPSPVSLTNQTIAEDPQLPLPTNHISAECHLQSETQSSSRDNGTKLMHLDRVRVSFLPLDALSKLPHKSKYHQRFNTIYFSASMVHQLDSSVKQLAAPSAVLVVELAKYLLDLSKEQEADFARRVSEIADAAGFHPLHPDNTDVYDTYTLRE